MIPEHCIKKFEERFKIYPSIISVSSNLLTDDLDKFLIKQQLLWFNDFFDSNGQRICKEKLVEHDPTGILIYINEGIYIVILTTVDRKSAAEFLIKNLKKIK